MEGQASLQSGGIAGTSRVESDDNSPPSLSERNSCETSVSNRPVPTASREPSRPTEEEERNRENERVKEFLKTLYAETVLKLCTRALQRGIGSMDYINTLLLMEDAVEDGDREVNNSEESNGNPHCSEGHQTTQPEAGQQLPPAWRTSEPPPQWCKCGSCRVMSQEIEIICCKKRKCVTEHARFKKVCLDADVLELCIKNRADIRNDREDNSTRTFRKAAYRQFILDKYGHLGKGKRKVAPSCVVWCVRHHYPARTGLYMGFRSH
ncbi:uncharacterized protein [Montipora foliosa]|uniref:uncharacterized protein n=1 Tax=Montipora foliosa TaxID=591990 RepID=UPI0035F143D7